MPPYSGCWQPLSFPQCRESSAPSQLSFPAGVGRVPAPNTYRGFGSPRGDRQSLETHPFPHAGPFKSRDGQASSSYLRARGRGRTRKHLPLALPVWRERDDHPINARAAGSRCCPSRRDVVKATCLLTSIRDCTGSIPMAPVRRRAWPSPPIYAARNFFMSKAFFRRSI
jgi:hypothetical protein